MGWRKARRSLASEISDFLERGGWPTCLWKEEEDIAVDVCAPAELGSVTAKWSTAHCSWGCIESVPTLCPRDP